MWNSEFQLNMSIQLITKKLVFVSWKYQQRFFFFSFFLSMNMFGSCVLLWTSHLLSFSLAVFSSKWRAEVQHQKNPSCKWGSEWECPIMDIKSVQRMSAFTQWLGVGLLWAFQVTAVSQQHQLTISGLSVTAGAHRIATSGEAVVA